MSDEEQFEEYVSGEDMILQAVAGANVTEDDEIVEEDANDHVASEEADSGFDNAEEELILGKFKTSDDLADAYKELERKFHERNSIVENDTADDDPEDDPEPLMRFDGGIPETEDELIDWSSQDPTRAALWAIENQSRVSEETFNEVYQNWWQERPWEAAAFQREQDLMMMQDYMQQQIMPFEQQREKQMLEDANRVLLERVPDIEQYAEKVQEFIQQNDVSSLITPEAMSNPDVLANGIDMIIGMIKWKEHQDSLRTGKAVTEDQKPIAQPPVVSTGNTAVADDSGDYEDAIRNFILNG